MSVRQQIYDYTETVCVDGINEIHETPFLYLLPTKYGKGDTWVELKNIHCRPDFPFPEVVLHQLRRNLHARATYYGSDEDCFIKWRKSQLPVSFCICVHFPEVGTTSIINFEDETPTSLHLNKQPVPKNVWTRLDDSRFSLLTWGPIDFVFCKHRVRLERAGENLAEHPDNA